MRWWFHGHKKTNIVLYATTCRFLLKIYYNISLFRFFCCRCYFGRFFFCSLHRWMCACFFIYFALFALFSIHLYRSSFSDFGANVVLMFLQFCSFVTFDKKSKKKCGKKNEKKIAMCRYVWHFHFIEFTKRIACDARRAREKEQSQRTLGFCMQLLFATFVYAQRKLKIVGEVTWRNLCVSVSV